LNAEKENPSESENEEEGFCLAPHEVSMIYGYFYGIELNSRASHSEIMDEIQRRELFVHGRENLIPALEMQDKLYKEMRDYLCDVYSIAYVFKLETGIQKIMEDLRK